MENKPSIDNTKLAVPISRAFHHLKSSLFSDSKSRPLNPNPNIPKSQFSTSSGYKLAGSGYSKSDTSIASSNLNEICSNYSSDVRDLTPPHAPLTDIGNRSSDVFGPVFGRKKVQDKRKDKGNQISVHLPINSSEFIRLRIRRTPAALPTEKRSDAGNADSKSVSCKSSVTIRNKKKEAVKPSSCPPILRTRNKRDVSTEAGDVGASHSFTAPRLQGNKKKTRLSLKKDHSAIELPREFVEQQRAYFQEIDDFKLVEEVASESESDTELHVAKT